MSTIRVASTGTTDERLRRLEQCANYEEEILCSRLPDSAGAVASYLAHWCIPWVDIRELLPDDRWAIWVAGFIVCANGATLTVNYVTNAFAGIALGVVSQPVTASITKFKIGPFAALGDLAPTTPRENIPSYSFSAVGTSGGTVSVLGPTFWLRMTPRNV